MLLVPTAGCHTATHREFSLDLVRPIEPLTRRARLTLGAPNCVIATRLVPPPPHPPTSLAAHSSQRRARLGGWRSNSAGSTSKALASFPTIFRLA
jgi:hypothetical protein